MKLCLTSPDGKEFLLDMLGPPTLFGELALLDGEARSANPSWPAWSAQTRETVNRWLVLYERMDRIRFRRGELVILRPEKIRERSHSA